MEPDSSVQGLPFALSSAQAALLSFQAGFQLRPAYPSQAHPPHCICWLLEFIS